MFDKKTCSMNRAKIVECDHAAQRGATPVDPMDSVSLTFEIPALPFAACT